MNAYEKWINLKEDMERAVEEGIECGYNKEEDTYKAGAFFAYSYMLDKMNWFDGYNNKEEYHND